MAKYYITIEKETYNDDKSINVELIFSQQFNIEDNASPTEKMNEFIKVICIDKFTEYNTNLYQLFWLNGA